MGSKLLLQKRAKIEIQDVNIVSKEIAPEESRTVIRLWRIVILTRALSY